MFMPGIPLLTVRSLFATTLLIRRSALGLDSTQMSQRSATGSEHIGSSPRPQNELKPTGSSVVDTVHLNDGIVHRLQAPLPKHVLERFFRYQANDGRWEATEEVKRVLGRAAEHDRLRAGSTERESASTVKETTQLEWVSGIAYAGGAISNSSLTPHVRHPGETMNRPPKPNLLNTRNSSRQVRGPSHSAPRSPSHFVGRTIEPRHSRLMPTPRKDSLHHRYSQSSPSSYTSLLRSESPREQNATPQPIHVHATPPVGRNLASQRLIRPVSALDRLLPSSEESQLGDNGAGVTHDGQPECLSEARGHKETETYLRHIDDLREIFDTRTPSRLRAAQLGSPPVAAADVRTGFKHAAPPLTPLMTNLSIIQRSASLRASSEAKESSPARVSANPWADQLRTLSPYAPSSASTFLFPDANYNPFNIIHQSMRPRLGVMSTHSSPSDEPIPLAFPPTTFRRSIRGDEGTTPLVNLVDSTPLPGDSTSEPSGGEKTPAEDYFVHSYVPISQDDDETDRDEVRRGTAVEDDSSGDGFVDDEDDEDDLLHLQFHPTYVTTLQKRRRRWESRWEALTHAVCKSFY